MYSACRRSEPTATQTASNFRPLPHDARETLRSQFATSNICRRNFESDPSPRGCGRFHHLVNRGDDLLNIAVMIPHSLFEILQLRDDLLICSQCLAHAYKRAYNENAHLDSFFRIEQSGRHDRAMFGERKWPVTPSASRCTSFFHSACSPCL